MIGGVSCSGSKSSRRPEDYAIALQMDTAKLVGRELVSEIAVPQVGSIEGEAKANKGEK